MNKETSYTLSCIRNIKTADLNKYARPYFCVLWRHFGGLGVECMARGGSDDTNFL